MQLINQIKVVTQQITDDELSRLIIEEELLIMLVKCSKHTLKTKSEAFEKIKDINSKQLEILGTKTKGVSNAKTKAR